MKLLNKSFAFALVAVFALSTIAATTFKATQWSVDKSHSSVAFKVSHFFTPVNGTFDEYEAEVYFDPANLEESSISVSIAVASVNTNNSKRDGHLQTPDFFNAEEFPNITFTSTEVVSNGDNQFVAKGQLTIKDVSKDVELPFTLLGVKDNPFQPGKKVAGMVSELAVSRTDFTVGTGDWAADTVIGDEVTITLNLELNTK